MAAGLIPPCFPYVDGAVSISATGRQEPVIFFFRAVLIPAAVLMILFWRLVGLWFRTVREARGVAAGAVTLFERGIGPVGWVAGLSLILYAVFLGTEGATYSFLRRYGVTVFFGFTFLAQLWTTGVVRGFARQGWLGRGWKLESVLLLLILFQLIIGLASLPLAEYAWNKGALQNIVEWNFALGMCSFFVVMGLVWRGTFDLQGRHTRR